MTGKEIINAKLIQDLKDNKRAFGLMTEEMQAKAEEIGFPGNFRIYQHPGFGGIIANSLYGHSGTTTYCLRRDYEETPGIVECEIIDGGYLSYFTRDTDVKKNLHQAIDDPDFIGVKNEGKLWGRLYRRKSTGEYVTIINFADLDEYIVCDLTEGNVVFRS